MVRFERRLLVKRGDKRVEVEADADALAKLPTHQITAFRTKVARREISNDATVDVLDPQHAAPFLTHISLEEAERHKRDSNWRQREARRGREALPRIRVTPDRDPHIEQRAQTIGIA